MNQEEIRIIREKQLVETIVDHINQNNTFTVIIPDSYEKCCKIEVDGTTFTITLAEFALVAKKLSKQ